MGGLSFFACTLFARKAKKEEEAHQNTYENHTAERSQKYEEARPRKVAKMSPNLLQNELPEAPFWLSEASFWASKSSWLVFAILVAFWSLRRSSPELILD